MSLFGPLFRYELARLARRGTQPKFRAAFALLLLIALFLAYLAAFPGTSPLQLLTEVNEPLSIDASSRFGERFVTAFLLTQVVIVLLVTPAVTAGAIGEDKDRGSLDLLLTTQLSSTEIVVGKFGARLVFVGSLLLTGLPVVTLVTFFGGVDIGQLAAGYAIALFTMLSLGAVSLFLSVVMKSLGSAILRSYIIALLGSLFGMTLTCFYYPAFASPIAVTWVLLNGWPRFIATSTPADSLEIVGIYGAVHSVLALLLIWLSVRRVRNVGARPIAPPQRTRRLDSLAEEVRERVLAERRAEREEEFDWGEYHRQRTTKGSPFEVARIPRRDRANSPPKVPDRDPLGWKERHFGGFFPELPALFSIAGGLSSIGVVLLLSFCCCLSQGTVVLGFLGATVVVGVGTSASVARERQRGTLESLLTLPVARRQILWAKLRMGLISGGWVALISLALGLTGLPMGMIAPGALVFSPIVFAGWMIAAGGLGMWLSVRCDTVERAVGYWITTAAVLCVLPPMISPLIRESLAVPNDPAAMYVVSLVRGCSPAVGIVNAIPSTGVWAMNQPAYQPPYWGAMSAAVLAGLTGGLFWWRAVRRFERTAV